MMSPFSPGLAPKATTIDLYRIKTTKPTRIKKDVIPTRKILGEARRRISVSEAIDRAPDMEDALPTHPSRNEAKREKRSDERPRPRIHPQSPVLERRRQQAAWQRRTLELSSRPKLG